MTESAISSDAGCVLVVDDEEGVRETLREVVEMAGCSAVLAANGAEALKLLEERRPCLIILDLLMPVMTGNEFIEATRQQPELAALPILISTSAPARAPPGFPVVAKPIDIEKVWECIKHSCRCSDAASTPS
jgi:CheY-like chemotaxis protein